MVLLTSFATLETAAQKTSGKAIGVDRGINRNTLLPLFRLASSSVAQRLLHRKNEFRKHKSTPERREVSQLSEEMLTTRFPKQ